jgi:hypothetical protein
MTYAYACACDGPQVTLDAEAAAPAVQLLLWYTTGGGTSEEEERLVAAHTTATVAGAARYTVSAAFSAVEAAPGEAVVVQVRIRTTQLEPISLALTPRPSPT